jgi:hypothetical protein
MDLMGGGILTFPAERHMICWLALEAGPPRVSELCSQKLEFVGKAASKLIYMFLRERIVLQADIMIRDSRQPLLKSERML